VLREVTARGERLGTDRAVRLHAGLHDALAGHTAGLTSLARDARDGVGGPLWAGFTLTAD
jgi:hypothetical protein